MIHKSAGHLNPEIKTILNKKTGSSIGVRIVKTRKNILKKTYINK